MASLRSRSRAPNPRLLLRRRPAGRVPAALLLHSAPSAYGSFPRASRSRSAGADLPGGKPSPCRAGAPRGARQAAARPLRRRVRSADEGWSAFLGAKVLRRTGSPDLRFRGESWEDCSRVGARTSRAGAARERKLRREHDVRFRLSDDPARLNDDLDILFSLHGARWHGGGGSFTSTSEAFHREFAICALERGWLRLWMLEVDDTPVAAWYGFRFGDSESYYQAGRDPAWSSAWVGFVQLVHTIREALDTGSASTGFSRAAKATSTGSQGKIPASRRSVWHVVLSERPRSGQRERSGGDRASLRWLVTLSAESKASAPSLRLARRVRARPRRHFAPARRDVRFGPHRWIAGSRAARASTRRPAPRAAQGSAGLPVADRTRA